MSTKIYYGKKLHVRDLAHLKEVLDEIKLENEEQVLKDLPFSSVQDGKISHQEYRELIKDFELEFAVGYDTITNSYYGFLLGHHDQQKLLDGRTEFEDFGYWDNTDPPEDVPEDEFYKRREIWDRLMPDYTSIGEQMFCIRLRINYLK
jgi:hypothetical protein